MSSFEVKGKLHNARYRDEKLHNELQKVQPLLRSRSDVQKKPDCELHIRLSDAHAQIVRNSSRSVISFLKVLDFQKCVAEQTTAQHVRSELESAVTTSNKGRWIQVQFSENHAVASCGFTNQDVFEPSQKAARYDANKKYPDVVPVLLISSAKSTDVTVIYSSTKAFFITTSSKGLSGLVQSEELEAYDMPNLQSFQMPSSSVVSLQPTAAEGAAAAPRARPKQSTRKRKTRSSRSARSTASAAAASHGTSQAADVEEEQSVTAEVAAEPPQEELSFSQSSQDSTDDGDSSDDEQQDQTVEPLAKRQRVETFLQEQISDEYIHEPPEPDGEVVEEFPKQIDAETATVKFTGEFFVRKCAHSKNVMVCINIGDQVLQLDGSLPTEFSCYFKFVTTNQEALQAVNADAALHVAERISAQETNSSSPGPLMTRPIKTEEPDDEYTASAAFAWTPLQPQSPSPLSPGFSLLPNSQ